MIKYAKRFDNFWLPPYFENISVFICRYQKWMYLCIEIKNKIKNMENEDLEHELIIDEIELEETGVIDEVEDELPPEEEQEAGFAIQIIEKIHSMFDSGCTKNTIAKELKLDRADVISVLDSYVGRRKINGNSAQPVDFVFNANGKKRIELGDRLNTSIYVKVDATPAEIEAKKAKWLKILNNTND